MARSKEVVRCRRGRVCRRICLMWGRRVLRCVRYCQSRRLPTRGCRSFPTYTTSSVSFSCNTLRISTTPFRRVSKTAVASTASKDQGIDGGLHPAQAEAEGEGILASVGNDGSAKLPTPIWDLQPPLHVPPPKHTLKEEECSPSPCQPSHPPSPLRRSRASKRHSQMIYNFYKTEVNLKDVQFLRQDGHASALPHIVACRRARQDGISLLR
ncbi:hypothetical protein BD410DRAFT_623390 [Rickenella mellea]|uniref:Uncharacterized protein n=1 Tax=Rickenella mellea TaxID=50990 RepID=A0A4Y7PLQ9_9AGAM|nr:hypothetical protein BD410DRAFT_623390 [Rickenella mellea]